MKKIINLKHISLSIAGLILVIAFNNCGEGFVAQQVALSSGSSSLFSVDAGESCEAALMRVYQKTYHPFLSQTCGACHTNGPGLGDFGSQDLATAFTSFTSVGATKINSQSLNTGHKPPATGDHNAARINELNTVWAASQTDYADCVSASGGGTAGKYVVTTHGKTVPANLTATTFVRMEWDLETESSNKVPLVAGIEIRRGVVGGTTRGYELRNPTLRLKSLASGNFASRALNIILNDKLKSEITTYSNIDIVISAITNLNLSPGSANAFMEATPDNSDKIALDFSSIKPTDSTNTGMPATGGGTGGGTPAPVTVPTYTQLAAAGGIFANSCFGCHNAGNARGGLDMTTYNGSRTAAINIRSRVNNANNPMPTGGLLGQAQRDAITAWVDAGTPQ